MRSSSAAVMLAAVLAAASVAAASPAANATDPRVRIIGRGRADGDGGWVFDWPNTFIFHTEGASTVTAVIEAASWARFRVFLRSGGSGYTNGRWAPTSVLTVAPGRSQYVLAAGLGDDKSLGGGGDASAVTVVLSKMDEADYNQHAEADMRATISSFAVPGGGSIVDPPSSPVPGLPLPTRRVEFIGDSITAAYGIGGTAPCSARPWMQESGRSYAFAACAALGAECHVQAWSGRGLVRNYQAEEPGTHMPEIERRVWAGVPSSPEWDFASWTPDAVWVNLGTNDACCGRDWPIPSFQPTYQALLKNITERYRAGSAGRAVPIFAAFGPMSSEFEPQLRAAAAAANADGARVTVVDHSGLYPGGPGREGCSGHPSTAGHQVMAATAVAAIANVTGWSPGQLNGETPAGSLQSWRL